jgi:hypothetical protein
MKIDGGRLDAKTISGIDYKAQKPCHVKLKVYLLNLGNSIIFSTFLIKFSAKILSRHWTQKQANKDTSDLDLKTLSKQRLA